MIQLSFLALCFERAFRINWHGLQTMHPTDVLTAIVFVWAFKYLQELRRISHSTRIVIRISVFLIFICGVFMVYLLTVSPREYLPTYHSYRLLAPFVKLWPYLQVPLWTIIGIAASYRAITRNIRKSIVIGLSGFALITTLRAMGSGNISVSLHSAFLGSVMHMLLAIMIVRLVNSRNPIKQLGYSLMGLILFSVPFVGALRGASFGSILIAVVAYLLSSHKKKGRFSVFLPILIALTLGYFVFSTQFSDRFEEDNPYEYESLSEVITLGFTPTGRTAQARIGWWMYALESLERSTIYGWGMLFSFQRSPSSPVVSARGVHNYYLSALIDGGLMLFIPLILLYIIPLCVGLKFSWFEDKYTALPVCWLLAIVLQRLTNTFAFGIVTSRMSSIITGYCIGQILILTARSSQRSRMLSVTSA